MLNTLFSSLRRTLFKDIFNKRQIKAKKKQNSLTKSKARHSKF